MFKLLTKQFKIIPHKHSYNLRIWSEGVGELVNPLTKSLLKQRQNKRERRLDVVSTEIHQVVQEILFLAGGLKLHKVAQPDREFKDKPKELREGS